MKKLLCLIFGHQWKYEPHERTEDFEGMIHPFAYGNGKVKWFSNVCCLKCGRRMYDLHAKAD